MRISLTFAETMTTARRKRKQYWAAAEACAGAMLGLVLVLASGVPWTPAVAGEPFVVDWHTGLAIDGYDPVAFFTEAKPVAGSDDCEYHYGGVVWRFANIGNRAAFAASPNVYMPQYGGYDPIGIAQGIAVPGNPNVWLVIGERLFLFYNDDRREKFAANPDRVISPADRAWPAVAGRLTQ
ncbi:MAG TPA: YHS domain-containing (seleno)protein [Xanthobacteraceae bacterium]|nr:YHS domain-containing (seleno)protein [Xanthobacteraceae bacterium]